MTIDLTKYVIGADLWEGDGDPDWGLLRDGGCQFVILRMNESWGALDLDDQFHNWKAAGDAGLARAAYVVIDPAISRQAYVNWILTNLPMDCEVVALDVEIKGSTPAAYSALLIGILGDLQAAGLRVLLYSGYWFYQYIKPWPAAFDQWWARYLNILMPNPPQAITWSQLKTKLLALDSFSPLDGYTVSPGHVAIWQLSSAFILPGGPAGWPIDINLMPIADFVRIFGAPPAPSDHELLMKLVAAHPDLF